VVSQASVLRDMETIIGPDPATSVSTDGFAVDGLVPQIAARPGTYDQVAQVLRYANDAGLAVIPWGAGTLMAIGNVPGRYDIALSLARLDAVIEHEPADLTVTCQAGITLGRLRQHLASSGQTVPLDPALPGEATIGGLLAADAFGPSRLAYGTARDFTIGMRVVTADGRLTRAGGKVVKNVAGYDLCKLYIGSLGTLGVIAETTFKVIPLPKAERALTLAFDSVEAACAFARQAHSRGLAVQSMLLTSRPCLLWTGLAGTPTAVERSARELEEMGRELGGRTVEPRPLAALSGALVCRFGTLPTGVPALIAAIEALGAAAMAYPSTGVVRGALQDATGAEVDQLREAAHSAGATMVIETAPPALKKAIDVFGEPPPAFALMRAVKQQFDPNGILTPGRFMGKL